MVNKILHTLYAYSFIVKNIRHGCTSAWT